MKLVESEGKGVVPVAEVTGKNIMKRIKRGMSLNEKIAIIMSVPDVKLTINMNGLRLLSYYNRSDLYEEYCDAIREKRFAVWREGKTTGNRRKINMEEANAIFAHFKELATAKQVIQ